MGWFTPLLAKTAYCRHRRPKDIDVKNRAKTILTLFVATSTLATAVAFAQPLMQAPTAEQSVIVEMPISEAGELPLIEAPPVPYAVPYTEPMPAPSLSYGPAAQPAVACVPTTVVREMVSLPVRRMLRRQGPPTRQLLCVDNPADCENCLYSVPVCLPGCCLGSPTVCNQRTGLLGRGYVDYVWPCGVRVTIVFRVHGGVILHYNAR